MTPYDSQGLLKPRMKQERYLLISDAVQASTRIRRGLLLSRFVCISLAALLSFLPSRRSRTAAPMELTKSTAAWKESSTSPSPSSAPVSVMPTFNARSFLRPHSVMPARSPLSLLCARPAPSPASLPRSPTWPPHFPAWSLRGSRHGDEVLQCISLILTLV